MILTSLTIMTPLAIRMGNSFFTAYSIYYISITTNITIITIVTIATIITTITNYYDTLSTAI